MVPEDSLTELRKTLDWRDKLNARNIPVFAWDDYEPDDDGEPRLKSDGGTCAMAPDIEHVDVSQVQEDDDEQFRLAEREALMEEHNEPIAPISTDQGRTDLANAKRLVAAHGQDLRFVGNWGKWLAFDGRRWKIDDLREVQARAKLIASSHWQAIADASGGDNATLGFAKRSCNKGGTLAMIELAADELAIHSDDLDPVDKSRWLLNLANGTLELSADCNEPPRLREHRREDLLTNVCEFAYNRDADCPMWRKFIYEIMDNDQAKVDYLQQLCGYWITGAVTAKILPILYGSGDNGKSVFVETMLALLNDYALSAPRGLLVTSKTEQHPTIRASLYRKRFVAECETGANLPLNEALAKQLTGMDTLTARRMREDNWSFQPTHKLVIGTNNKPRIQGTDQAIWNRIKLVPFTVTIPEEKQDGNLGDKLKATELPGILNWCLIGLKAWQADGFIEPDEVRVATDEYRADSDSFGAFLADAVEESEYERVQASVLYQAYQEQGGRLNQTNFGLEMKRRGYEKRTGSGGFKYYMGVCLREQR